MEGLLSFICLYISVFLGLLFSRPVRCRIHLLLFLGLVLSGCSFECSRISCMCVCEYAGFSVVFGTVKKVPLFWELTTYFMSDYKVIGDTSPFLCVKNQQTEKNICMHSKFR